MPGPNHVDFGRLPLVAAEIIVSESQKALRGSVTTLEMVSPAFGLLLLHNEEIRRMLVGAGASPDQARNHVLRLKGQVEDLAARSRQRLEVWTFGRLRHRYESLTGHPWIWVVAH
jgi:hypothetical protein